MPKFFFSFDVPTQSGTANFRNIVSESSMLTVLAGSDGAFRLIPFELGEIIALLVLIFVPVY